MGLFFFRMVGGVLGGLVGNLPNSAFMLSKKAPLV